MKKQIAMLISSLLVVTSCVSAGLPNWQMPVSADVKESQNISEETDAVDMSKLLDMSELYGWAAVQGEGIDTTTGGGNTTPVVVTTAEEFKNAVSDDLPRVVVVSGEIVSMSSGVKEKGGYAIDVGSNKTIVGIDSNAKLYGGLNIKNKTNIVICNLNIQGTWPNTGPDDTINVENSHHVWLNHLNIWNSTDGNIDIKMGSDYISVSWCKMWYEDAMDFKTGEMVNAKDHPHRLSCLIGSGAGDHDDTDMGKLRVTYHHNWFAELLKDRMPRVMYGRVHVYNNYYTSEDNSNTIGVDSYASVFIENNYFKKVNNPHGFSYDPGLPASIVARGNEYVDTTGSKVTGQHYSNSKIKPFETTVYDYYLNDAKDIPDIVSAYVGPQNLSDETAVPEKYKNGSIIKGVEDSDEELPEVLPLPTLKPTNTLNDNPITYDEESGIYTYHGQNSNGSNAYYTIENPFKGYDFSEDPFGGADLNDPYIRYYLQPPNWTKGATISYWVKVPEDAIDAAVLNFNLENDRQIQRDDAVKYRRCLAYSPENFYYLMSDIKTFVDDSGKEYKVLSYYGDYVQYNPNYPTEGCYVASDEGGSIYAYEKKSDGSLSTTGKYLNYIGKGYYENYSVRFDEEGGSKSLIREAKISGSLSLYASGSMGYRQDNFYGLQMNPYLLNYGQVMDAYQYNQHYYWGNGGYKVLKSDGIESYTPTMAEKGEWHFVVVVIKNDWIQYYMDGKEMTVDYLNWWGDYININTGSKGFNYGFGMKMAYRSNPDESQYGGMTILDFISDEDTVLTIGGLGAGATRLGQEHMGTPEGVKVKDFKFYFTPIDAKYIDEDRINVDENGVPIEPYKSGDLDGNELIELTDVQLALKGALTITSLDDREKKAADVVKDGKITLDDVQRILKCALIIIPEEELEIVPE